jgi:hypothetical protein
MNRASQLHLILAAVATPRLPPDLSDNQKQYLRGNPDVDYIFVSGDYAIGLTTLHGFAASAFVVPKDGIAYVVTLPDLRGARSTFTWHVSYGSSFYLATPLPTPQSTLAPRTEFEPIGGNTMTQIDCAGIASQGLAYVPVTVPQFGPTYLVRIDPKSRTTWTISVSDEANPITSLVLESDKRRIRVRQRDGRTTLVSL